MLEVSVCGVSGVWGQAERRERGRGGGAVTEAEGRGPNGKGEKSQCVGRPQSEFVTTLHHHTLLYIFIQ